MSAPGSDLRKQSPRKKSQGPVGSGRRMEAGIRELKVEGGGSSSGRVEQPMSSAAFLHHLHNDPSSHHISLAAPAGSSTPTRSRTSSEAGKIRVLSQGPSKAGSPKSLQLPLEPTVAAVKPKSATDPAFGATHGGAGEILASAGPSTEPSRPLVVQRQLSTKRGRPSTAPGATRSPGEMGGSPQGYFGGGSNLPSPDVELEPISAAESPFIPPQPAVDSMLSCEMPDDAGVADAVSMMSISSGSPPTRVFGRAGPTLGQPPSRRSVVGGMSGVPSPPAQLSWKAFGMSYAHGLFDSNKIPNPPVSDVRPTETRTSFVASADSSPSHRPSVLMAAGSSSGSAGLMSTDSEGSGTTMTSTSSAPVSSIASSAPKSSMAAALAARQKALELESIPQTSSAQVSLRPDQLRLPSYSMAAATVRMAASGFHQSDFAPLAVPSPERELTDPLASFVPGSSSGLRVESASSDPGSRNALSRSMSSAVVGRTELPTILASPAATPMEHPRHQRSNLSSVAGALAPPKPEPARVASSPGALGRTGAGGVVANQRIPPATAPIEKASAKEEDEEDYFGSTSTAGPRFDRQQSSVSYTSQSSSNQTVTNATSTPMVRSKSSEGHPPTPPPSVPRTQSHGSRPGSRPGSSSGPGASTGVSLPLPSDSPPPLVNAGDVGALYEKYGWLAAPMPPDETARRKALYRFNILHTSPDVNFDRIAHMAKLVFSTKIVLIALIDGAEQWHKSHTGLGTAEAKRISSFCSHTLLVQSDEPFVVLDATQDWRFANNPQVLGPPNIRFYAGAPLRTADGYNLGSLCIIDDKPRTEFPPRSRLILKEFAAVCMREMELWRDKLQLRIRDKIQTSMEKFTRECLEMDAKSPASNIESATRMDQVYARAASLICSTLDIDGCFILDLGQFESVDVETERGVQSVYRADPYSAESTVLELSGTFGPVNPFPVLAASPNTAPTRALTGEEHRKMSDFLMNHRDGRIFEKIAPSWIRYLFPADLKYGMVVPVFGVNQQPFALIAAYSNNNAKQFLEGYELQFLRAIGVIILSAVLRRRMVLADKTKSVLISSVSHELRTPLHGILAAAELLSDTNLDLNQLSFLKTVQTCGNTLIETVNHVLDFTKLSGSSGSSSEGSIKLAKVNLATLIEQTVEGVWIGQRARFFMGDADVGSFYAPPSSGGGGGLLTRGDQAASIAKELAGVETVIDIGYREKGWMVRCERGGLRRVLMNLVGNSLKFTKPGKSPSAYSQDGYVQITLKELPHSPGSKMIPVEMAVIDTGKGIGKDFLKDQLFHPFSQENPLQTGTGLGLAIVNSIVRSDNVNGKVDVWSSEGKGTEIRVSFEVEVFDEEDDQSTSSESSVTSSASNFGRGHSVSFFGYDTTRRGSVLALDVLSSYAGSWQFDLTATSGDIYIINEADDLMHKYRDIGKPLILLRSSHVSMTTDLRDAINQSGGYCQIVHKPIGPTVLRQALHRAVVWLERGGGETTPMSEVERPILSRNESERTDDSTGSNESNSTISDLAHRRQISGQQMMTDRQPLLRRRSEEPEHSLQHSAPARPALAPRGLTYHHAPPDVTIRSLRKSSVTSDTSELDQSPTPGSPGSSASHLSTISLADGGVMLKAAQLPLSAPRIGRTPRVMVVEDNVINRRVLGAFLKKRGYEWAEAYDGQSGVNLFEQTDPDYWDVILMDISMPIMNGHEATRAIRKIESARRSGRPASEIPSATIPAPGQPVTPATISLPPPKVLQSRVKIFALTGLATSDDKREAFGSGVDGYLVKPVSLTSLDLIFKKIGY